MSTPQLKHIEAIATQDLKPLVQQEIALGKMNSAPKSILTPEIRSYNATRAKQPTEALKAPGLVNPLFEIYLMDQLILVDMVRLGLYNVDRGIQSLTTRNVDTIFDGVSIPIPTYKVPEYDPKLELEYVNASTRIKDFMESGVYSFWDESAKKYDISSQLYEGQFADAKKAYVSTRISDPENEIYKADNKLHSTSNIYKAA